MSCSRSGRPATVTASLPWFDREGFAAFEEIWFVDFEFISRPGKHPDVLCLCAYDLHTGKRIQLWENQLGPVPPYRTDAGALFVCFAATAECACHLALGWPLPSKVLDLSPLFRNYINGRTAPAEGKGLIGALRHFGLDTVGGKYKEVMRTRILQGRPYSAEEIAQIQEYCLSDVIGLPALLEALLERLPSYVTLDTMLHWGEFVAVSAAMEHRGVPVNMEIASLLLSKEAWAYVRDAIVPRINPQYDVYVQEGSGGWSFSIALFEAYCARAGIVWPRHEGSDNSTFATRSSTPWPRPIRRRKRCASCAMPATRCGGSSSRSAPTGGIERCSGRSSPRPGARSRKPPSGFSARRCGCGP